MFLLQNSIYLALHYNLIIKQLHQDYGVLLRLKYAIILVGFLIHKYLLEDYKMDKIHDVHERVERIEEKLDKIINLLEHNQKSADKMSDHIDFIDGVYSKVKSPLNTIFNAVSRFSIQHNPQAQMLELPDKKED